ncbi:MAG: DUF4398 domain-containing protein [Halomonadaceae bacterium]|nr:MAG: DUF4398 domain-containing protein [Halomonadaceae bacterium]
MCQRLMGDFGCSGLIGSKAMKIFPAFFLHPRTTPLFSFVLVLLLAACASAPPPPTESLNAARDAIASAEDAEARQYAPADLEEARAQLVMAEKAVEGAAMVQADQLAQQSRVVAELAKERTLAAKAAAINRQLKRDADALDEEMGRQGEQR